MVRNQEERFSRLLAKAGVDDFSSMREMIFPINVNDTHWSVDGTVVVMGCSSFCMLRAFCNTDRVMVRLDIESKTAQVYDSLHGRTGTSDYALLLIRFVCEEYNKTSKSGEKWNEKQWQVQYPPDLPKQPNRSVVSSPSAPSWLLVLCSLQCYLTGDCRHSYDCGVYVLRFIECLLTSHPPQHAFDAETTPSVYRKRVMQHTATQEKLRAAQWEKAGRGSPLPPQD